MAIFLHAIFLKKIFVPGSTSEVVGCGVWGGKGVLQAEDLGVVGLDLAQLVHELKLVHPEQGLMLHRIIAILLFHEVPFFIESFP